MKIPFNKPYLSGNELKYIRDAVESGKISGNGKYTKLCHEFLESRYGFRKTLLTTSCTDALEMAALLIDIQPGDEVIIPSFTFVSTANAFALRGAKIVLADSSESSPNLSVEDLKRKINNRTKAIVVVHYAGVACEMDEIMKLAGENELFVIEDAAQAIDSYHNNKILGSIGDLAAFSFHETKNIIAGEGGFLAINNEKFIERAEILWEKGTNRASFYRGEVDKYTWVDVGSSFLPSELNAAYLFAQLESLDQIQQRRKDLWDLYYELFKKESGENYYFQLPLLPDYATNNAHLFYLICSDVHERDELIKYLKQKEIHAVFHYIPLNKSAFFKKNYGELGLPNAERFSDTIIRLPLFYELEEENVKDIVKNVLRFYEEKGQKYNPEDIKQARV